MSNPLNLDALTGLYFSSQLAKIEEEIYEAKFPELDSEMLLPQRKLMSEEVFEYRFRSYETRGRAVPKSGNEDGAPNIDLLGDEKTARLIGFIDSYSFSTDDIKAAKKASLPLDRMLAMGARKRIASELNRLALLGNTNANVNIEGLFSLSQAQTGTVPNGAAASPLWVNKTADEILADLFFMADTISNFTLDVESAKTLVLPLPQVRFLSTKPRASGTDQTVLSFFQMQRPNIKVMGAQFLGTAGAGGTKRAVAYDPSMVSMLVKNPFEVLAPQYKGFRAVINCEGAGGGVVAPYPKSVLYVDGF
jgi:hypothetical protein